ncbi:hypothetical protein O1611_g7113 [Lasiodiplodia mahajangana]|uniref:Uncharacterized protein n=1 Tax=Lasiodiplodia mahajangana TaxID=1108764 RepID=A0ACC2JGH9_9PEZI|nr:hypothetical protein O1611_g7113 [Lasiodiplodia mahajangana]
MPVLMQLAEYYSTESGLSLAIEEDRAAIGLFFDDKQGDGQRSWEAILDYFKQRWIREDSDGQWTVQDDAPGQGKAEGMEKGRTVPSVALDDVNPTILKTICHDTIFDLFKSKRIVVDPQAQVANNYKRMSTDHSGAIRRSRASSDPSTDRLLKRKRSDDVFEGLPGKRLCIRDEEKVGNNDERTLEERRYTEALRDVYVHLSTLSDKTGVG